MLSETRKAGYTTSWPAIWGFIRCLQWVVIPLLVFVIAEVEFRKRFNAVDHSVLLADLIRSTEQAMREGPQDFLFVGVSRVAAAFDEKSFEEVMAIELARPIRAAYLGAGGSAPREWLLGLRKLVHDHPGCLRGCVVFFRSPGRSRRICTPRGGRMGDRSSSLADLLAPGAQRL